MKPKFKRVMLKISGEGLAGADGSGIDAEVITKIALQINELHQDGVQICIVAGGGNFFRGAKSVCTGMDRSVADQIGMLATVMNAMALKSALEGLLIPIKVFSGIRVPQVCDDYTFKEASRAMLDGNVLIFAGGTGSPYFTTDTGAALRAIEMHCDILMKATQVDGVYDADPRINPNAERYDTITFSEVLAKHLNVLDMTAVSMAEAADLPVMIFALNGEKSIVDAVYGKEKCTIIKKQ
ncbi:MAG: UMP kinase [Alphaproteobacteria bacterium]|nr:UMP kinase [Alphaproteobacteria bacterium]